MNLKYVSLTLKMTSGDAKNDTIELVVLKKTHMDPEIVPLALQEVTIAEELPKFRNLTLRYDLFDLEDDRRCC